MVTRDTIDFYNEESGQYSKKRYEGQTLSYFQFLFKRRRELFLGLIRQISPQLKNSNILEIGCADGVLIKKLLQKFPDVFQSIVGVDVSPKMLELAKKTTNDPKVKYFFRGEEPEAKYDLVIELGVHVQDFDEEMHFVSDRLNNAGYFIYSAAGKSSLHAKIKLRDKEYARDYLDYSQYENIIKKYFEIIHGQVYGLFIPKLWSIPVLARIVQPIIEVLLSNIFPNLFHEKIYFLRKKY